MTLAGGLPASACPSTQIGPGFGAVPVGSAPNTAVTFFERSRPTPISYQFNFDAQHELANNLLLEVGYLANLSHHLDGPDMSIDQVPPSLMGPGKRAGPPPVSAIQQRHGD